MKKRIPTPAEIRRYNKAVRETLELIQTWREQRKPWPLRATKNLKRKVVAWYTKR